MTTEPQPSIDGTEKITDLPAREAHKLRVASAFVPPRYLALQCWSTDKDNWGINHLNEVGVLSGDNLRQKMLDLQSWLLQTPDDDLFTMAAPTELIKEYRPLLTSIYSESAVTINVTEEAKALADQPNCERWMLLWEFPSSNPSFVGMEGTAQENALEHASLSTQAEQFVTDLRVQSEDVVTGANWRALEVRHGRRADQAILESDVQTLPREEPVAPMDFEKDHLG